MQITFLGHAGFLVETDQAIIVTDPWFSPEGAFDSAWFQFPCNHHMSAFVQEKLVSTAKSVFVYVSHEHRDHFDPTFLAKLPLDKVTFVVAQFQRPVLRNQLATLRPLSLTALRHGESLPIPGGQLKIYLDDSGLNRDSALLVKSDAGTFLNLNDCKLYDEVASIRKQEGPISVFTCQFSGATWHPTCYDYDPNEYKRISAKKARAKFDMVARAIELVGSDVYLPSAGPACFLDPALLHLNFEPVNIFPRAPQFLDYLRARLRPVPALFDLIPGDTVTTRGDVRLIDGERVSEHSFEEYIRSYAAKYRDHFTDRQPHYSEESASHILDALRESLQNKLREFALHDRIQVPMYFGLRDFTTELLRIDFPKQEIDRVPSIAEQNYYSLRAPTWQIARLLNDSITWEEFALTFRMRLNRQPDVYQTLIQGFLLMEPADMNWFCARLVEIEQRGKRITVEASGTRYSIDRYCPHQGGDLSEGWAAEGKFWVCPRHHWQFDLDKCGQCTSSTGSIHAVCLENE